MDTTVVKGFNLLETLTSSDRPRGVSELSREMRLTKSNVQRLLSTMLELGYVQKDPVTSHYSATLKMWEFGHRVLSRDEIKRAAIAHLRSLHQEVGETVFLCVSSGYDVLYVDIIENPNPIRIFCTVGMRVPQWKTASGKVILANRPSAEIEAAFDLMQQATPTRLDRNAWREEFTRIRTAGYARSEGAFRPGVNSIAAPICDSAGEVVASLALSAPSERSPPETLDGHSLPLVHAALRVSQALGFSG
jgi:IclR family transcriptional regulator, KDG regulon repressor